MATKVELIPKGYTGRQERVIPAESKLAKQELRIAARSQFAFTIVKIAPTRQLSEY